MSNKLAPHKANLLSSCVSANSISFGTFVLKSGRESPYFFNAGSLHSSKLLSTLAHAFAVTISENFGDAQDPGFDVVFGPAYKGIPLACTTVQALFNHQPERYGGTSYCFDRKTVKAYGDGGKIVGAPLSGRRVLVVDDVITAGTAIREALATIESQGGKVVGVVVALDRQEKAPSVDGVETGFSAIGQVRKQYGLPVVAVLTLDDIIAGCGDIGTEDDKKRLLEYRELYKAVDP